LHNDFLRQGRILFQNQAAWCIENEMVGPFQTRFAKQEEPPRKFLPPLVTLLFVSTLTCPFVRGADQQGRPGSAFQETVSSAWLLFEEGRYQQALRGFKKANKLAKNSSADCHMGLAETYWRLGNPKATLEHCQRALEITAQDSLLQAQARNLRGVVLNDQARLDVRKLQEAEREFRLALGHPTAFPVAHFNLGLSLLRQGRDEEGLQQLAAYLQAAPDGPSARRARFLLENPAKARERLAPDFSAVSLQGEEISSTGLLGKVVLLDFWATWCPPCQRAVPDLRRISKAFSHRPFVLVGISVDRDENKWREYVAGSGMEWPQLVDRKNALGRAFGIRVVPTYVVMDAEGIIRLWVHELAKPPLVAGAIEDCLRDLEKSRSRPQQEGSASPRASSASLAASPKP